MNGKVPASCFMLFTGSRSTPAAALILKNKVSTHGCSCTLGTSNLFIVSVAVMETFAINATNELSILCQILSCVDATVPIVSNIGGSTLINDIYSTYLGSENQRKLIEFPIFSFCLLKRCTQKSSSSVFGSMDAFSLIELVVTRLMMAVNWNWMMSRKVLREL